MLKHLVVLVALVGCGGGGGIAIEDLPAEIEGARCDQLVACEGAPDRATCEASIDVGSGYGSIEAGVDDGSIKYNAGKAKACADSFGSTTCLFPGFHDGNPCDEVFTGTVATGGACMIDLQCAKRGQCVQTDANCDRDIACCAGTCSGMLTESAVGEPCNDGLHFCADNSFCRAGITGPGVCTALIKTEGAPCDELDACANPMYCNLSSSPGACKKPAASGATCTRVDPLPCVDSRDYCDPTMLTCVRAVAVGGACAPGIACVSYASCISSKCVANIPAGGTCQAGGAPPCAGDLECVGGKCQLPPAGMTCALP